jgi:mycothiol synthase
MQFTIRPYETRDLEGLQRLLHAPGITDQYDLFAGPEGARQLLADPHTPHDGVRLAYVDGAPVGFGYAILLPGPPTPWTVLRGAVLPAFRRHGIGRALHDVLREFVRTQRHLTGIRESALSAWVPESGAEGLASTLGYAHERWYWLMERPRGGMPAARAWPTGVTVRPLDLSDSALADWNDAYNASFAEHHRFVASPIEHVHQLIAKPGFRADSVLLAYRNGRVAGFCRNDLFERRGEIGTLGTVPEARGIGLGRALLRWGVAWLERECALPVTLLVDGANEGALALYRGEGFEVARTRRMWVLPAAGN